MAFPTIHACLLCEIARQELGNKYILLGFYGALPTVNVNVPSFKLPIHLCHVFCGGPGEGHFKIDLKITAPNGQDFSAPPIEGDLFPQSTVINFYMGWDLTLPGPGVYKVTLLANGNPVYENQFSLGLAQAPPNTAGSPKAPVPSSGGFVN
jgi:hypothetical protein